MKKPTTLIILLICIPIWGQTSKTTDEILVTGLLEKELKFSLDDILKYPSNTIGEVAITNHMGEPRGTAKQLTGVLVKDLLENMELKEESPKRFSEFYLTFVAIDDYKVVYSWNEIFNSPTGEHLFLITSRDGNELKDMPERILVLTPTDFKTGRRHIKGLSRIIVERVK
ncbi:MAG: molybdopterin-binding protein [Flavobacteriaceae bacterium]|nr:molybdopterin-binding protein [Flavobacteriaceae bacterium]